MREAGLIVNETAKIHVDHPDESHHSIYCPTDSLRIPLCLHGIFSFFNHRTPLLSEINNLDVIFLTPDASHWNPNSDHFAKNEDSFMDCDGHVIDNPPSINHDLLTNEDDAILSSLNMVGDTISLPSVLTVDSAIDYSIADFSMSTDSTNSANCSAAVFDMQNMVNSISATVGSALQPNALHDETNFFQSSPNLNLTASP